MKQQFIPEIWMVKRKPFNPEQWLTQAKPKRQRHYAKPITETGIQHDVETIVRRVEAHRLDLTYTYEDWVKLGFAFASEFGEIGRNYFHRVSRFNSTYNSSSCNQQYNKCLKSHKTGTTIRSFFASARDAGISIKV